MFRISSQSSLKLWTVSRQKRLLGCMFIGLFFLSGCATTLADLNRKRAEIKTVESEMRATDNALAVIDRYHQFLSNPKGEDLVLIGKKTLKDSIQAYMPYVFKGKELSSKLRGRYTLTKAKGFELLSGNRARFQFEFKGEKVNVIIPSKYKSFVSKKDILKMKASLRSGGTITIDVVAYYSKDKKALALKADCTAVSLRKHNTRRHQDELKKGINKRVLNRRKYIPLPEKFTKKHKKIKVLTSPNHLILMPQSNQ